MRVAIDVSAAIYGSGVSQYVINLVRHLPSNILTLVGFSLRRQADITQLFPSATTFPLPPTLLDILWNKLHIVNFENFAPGDVDIYHSSDWAQAPDSSQKVTTVHDLVPFLYPQETSPNIVSAHTARMRWVVKECDHIICVSHNTENDLLKLFPAVRGRTSVISEAVPLDHVRPAQPSKYSGYVVAIGARQPRKNIARLVSAYTQYRSKYSLPEKLVVIGEASFASSDPNIIFTGYLSYQDLVNTLAGAQAFVFPSLYEGFGLPILEAFYHQVPVACSNLPVFSEVGESAVEYFDPLDEEAIAQSIHSAIKHAKKLTTTGQKLLTKYSWSDTADQTLKIYQSLL